MSLTRLSWVCIKHFAKGRAVVSYALPGGSQQDDPKSRYALHGLRLALAYVLLASSFYDDYYLPYKRHIPSLRDCPSEESHIEGK